MPLVLWMLFGLLAPIESAHQPAFDKCAFCRELRLALESSERVRAANDALELAAKSACGAFQAEDALHCLAFFQTNGEDLKGATRLGVDGCSAYCPESSDLDTVFESLCQDCLVTVDCALVSSSHTMCRSAVEASVYDLCSEINISCDVSHCVDDIMNGWVEAPFDFGASRITPKYVCETCGACGLVPTKVIPPPEPTPRVPYSPAATKPPLPFERTAEKPYAAPASARPASPSAGESEFPIPSIGPWWGIIEPLEPDAQPYREPVETSPAEIEVPGPSPRHSPVVKRQPSPEVPLKPVGVPSPTESPAPPLPFLSEIPRIPVEPPEPEKFSVGPKLSTEPLPLPATALPPVASPVETEPAVAPIPLAISPYPPVVDIPGLEEVPLIPPPIIPVVGPCPEVSAGDDLEENNSAAAGNSQDSKSGGLENVDTGWSRTAPCDTQPAPA